MSEVASSPDTQPTVSADDYVISKAIIPQDGAVSCINELIGNKQAINTIDIDNTNSA